MREIHLTQGKIAFVDDEDFERVSQFNWYASLDSRGTKYYAKRRSRKTERHRWIAVHIRLHHFILDIPAQELGEGRCVDHVNGNGLDCRKSNLEVVTFEENMARSAGWRKKREEPWL